MKPIHCGYLVVFFAVCSAGFGSGQEAIDQSAAPPTELVAPRSDLRPVPIPDSTKLESAVQEQLDRTEEELKKAIQNPNITDEELSDKYGLSGRVYHVYELSHAAEACYLNASTLRPSNFAWVYLLARLYHQEGSFDQAITWYRRAQTLRRDYPALFVNAGNLLLEQNTLQLAEEAFKAALTLAPSDPSVHFGLGSLHLARREFQVSIAEFEQVLRVVPQANRVHYHLAMAYRGLGDVERARSHLDQMGPVGIKPTDPLIDGLEDLRTGERSYLLRGRRAYNAGDFQGAIREFRGAVHADPQSARARINLGSALAQTGEINEAVQQFEAALSIDPGNVTAKFNLGSIALSQREYQIAKEHFQQLLFQYPDDVDAIVSLGKTLRRLGDNDSAESRLKKALELDSSNEEAVLELAGLQVEQERYSSALELLKNANETFPSRGLTAHAPAKMLAACPDRPFRDGARALELAQRTFEALPLAIHAETVSLALAELGRCQEAADWLDRAVELARRQSTSEEAQRLEDRKRGLEGKSDCRP